MSDRFQFPPASRDAVPRYWAEACVDLDPPDLAFGPEWTVPRPRPAERYFLIWDTAHVLRGAKCGDGTLGLIFLSQPAPTTMRFGIGLWALCRGQGLGPAICDDAYDFIFAGWPEIYKLESEVYTSNLHSLSALHGPKSGRRYRAREEGRQRATISIGDRYYDRVLYGYDRDEWFAVVNSTGEVLT
ncbi:MAG TPA: GNAT family protein [Methylomirabilota bacterium]|nr:GNAT family protein [Methylomirabilota bacterium]